MEAIFFDNASTEIIPVVVERAELVMKRVERVAEDDLHDCCCR